MPAVSEARLAARAVALQTHQHSTPEHENLIISRQQVVDLFLPDAVRADFHEPGCIHCVEARELLDMLGLLDEDGALVEPEFASTAKMRSDTAIHTPNLNNGPGARRAAANEAYAGRDRWAENIPEGLRSYDPAAIEAALRKTPKTRRVPDARPDRCGTLGGRSRHQKRGEKLCEPCRIAYNQYQSDARKKRMAARALAATAPQQKAS